jgi:hypothetical protein
LLLFLQNQPFVHKNYIIFPAKHENSKWKFYTFFDLFKAKNKNKFHLKIEALATKAFRVCTILLLFAAKRAFFDKIYIIFSKRHGNSNW